MTKEWMTPDELAIDTGYSRQTINKWIKRQGWKTVHKPGVQGGKARLIHIDAEVEQFLSTVRPAAEPIGHYFSGDQRLTALLLSSIDQMSQREKEQLSGLLLREGIRGVLLRLDLLDEEK